MESRPCGSAEIVMYRGFFFRCINGGDFEQVSYLTGMQMLNYSYFNEFY
jgi:hypothetical protein